MLVYLAIFWGLPEGVDAFALKYLFDHHENQSIFIAVDDAAMDRMRSSLLLLGVPEEQILYFSMGLLAL